MKYNFAHELSPVESLAADLEKAVFSGQYWSDSDWARFRAIPLICEEDARTAYEMSITDSCAQVAQEYVYLVPVSQAYFNEACGEVLSRADALTDEALNALSAVHVEEAEEDFIAGWEKAGGLTADLEAGAPEPWCCPWLWKSGWDWDEAVRCGSARKAGALWWAECEDEVERLAEEEALDREAEEE